MDISITSVRAISGGEEIEICFAISDGEHSQRQSFVVSSQQYLVMGLSKGKSCEQDYDEAARQSEIWSCTKKAMASLAYGNCSEKALRAKLVTKGFNRDVARTVVEQIASRGLLSERSDAAEEASKMAKKLWGERRIIAELYRKGYTDESVRYALCALEDDGVDYVESCRRLIMKRGVPSDANETKKLFAALMRYGYSSSQIKQALECVND